MLEAQDDYGIEQLLFDEAFTTTTTTTDKSEEYDDDMRFLPKRRVPVHELCRSFNNDNITYARTVAESVAVKPMSFSERTAAGLYDENADAAYGDRLLNDVVRAIGEFGKGKDRIRLRPVQHVMLAHCLNALLPVLYGDQLEANRERLLRQLRLEKIHTELVIIASRRAGKTWFVSILLAALLICVPAIEIACFAMQLRASRKVMRLVIEMLQRHELGRTMIRSRNQEDLELVGAREWEKKLMHSYPGSTTHVRSTISVVVERGRAFFFFVFFIIEIGLLDCWLARPLIAGGFV